MGWWHAVVFRIALGLSEVQWTLFDVSDRNKPKQIYDHPVLDLLHLCNPFQTSEELIALDTIYMESLGESFWVLNSNQNNEPGEIILPYPEMMSVVPSKQFPFVKGYVYGSGEQAVPLDVNQVIHFKYPNPLNQYRGLGQAQAIGINLSAEKNADKWVDQFFYNSARPDGVIQFDYSISDEQFEKLKKQWAEKYKGVSNAHQVALLEGGGKYVQIQNSVKDMDFPNLKQKNRDIILGVEGMPLSMMGITENVNRCLSEKHRVFTESGLKHFGELTENDKVLTFNPELREAEFQKPLNIYSYDYDDDLIIFDNWRIHAEVTPNHRLYIAGSNCRNQGGLGSWGFKQARALEDTSISHWLVATGKPILRGMQSIINIPKVEYIRTGRKGSEPPDEGYNVDAVSFASFCGLLASEGWLSGGTGKSINFGCSLGTKALNSFERIIKELPFGEWSHWDNLNASSNGMRTYHHANKSLWTWLQSNIGAGAKNKHIPEFVLKGNAQIMKAFLDTYTEGDGHICNKNGTVLIRSHSPRMIDELLFISVLLGYHASISGKTAVIISKHQHSYFRNYRSIHREHYQGKVWCVEIPNGIFFTECNGKVHATGNSNAEAGDYTFARWILKPRLDWKRAKLQEQLLPKFKNSKNLKICFEEIVPETAEQRRLDAESGMRAGYLTVNEARVATGKDPLPGDVGDVLLLPLNLIPTPIKESLQSPAPAPAPTPVSEESEEVQEFYKGGEGSGNFGHEGRPGEIGGSGEGGGTGNPFDPESSKSIRYNVPYDKATPKEESLVDNWQKNLPSEQKAAVDDWQEHGFKEIRSSQIQGELSPELQTKIKNLDAATKTAPTFDKPIYRGIKNLASEDVSRLANAEEITLEAHSSFSGSKHTAFGFTNGFDPGEGASTRPIRSVYFEVRSGGGPLIQTTEREVLLPKGKTFSITNRRVIQYQGDRERVLHLTLEMK